LGKPELSGAILHDQFSHRVTEINCLESLQELANRGFKHIYSIPKAYQAIIKRSCLDEIYKIGGTYTPGPSPDMAAAVALSFVVKKFVAINLPVIIVGQSQHLGGGERALKGRVKNIDDVPFLPPRAKEHWDKRIPKVWCTQTVWPESAIKAIEYMGKEGQIRINYEFILAWFMQTHPFDQGLAYKLSQNKKKLFAYLAYYKIVAPILSIITKVKSIFTKGKLIEGRERLVSDILDIEQACNYFVTHYPDFMHMNFKDTNSLR
jgi:hypothetical protein